MVEESILISIKKLLGINSEDLSFDTDIIMGINSALMNLQQLGVGPSTGLFISSSSETWEDFLEGRTDLEAAKMYVFFKVKLGFDPPQNSFLVDAIKSQITELEFRINVQAEGGT